MYNFQFVRLTATCGRIKKDKEKGKKKPTVQLRKPSQIPVWNEGEYRQKRAILKRMRRARVHAAEKPFPIA